MIKKTWFIEDHLCKKCGGRILKSATGQGMTPGGNPVFKCADCGESKAAISPHVLCWCGFSYKLQYEKPYRCVSYSILDKYPELINAFKNLGFDPNRGGEAGIVLYSDLLEIKKKEKENGVS